MLGLIIGGVIVVILLVILMLVVSSFNRFKTLKNGAESTLAQIKVALKKRLDMITQLVDTTKSYANYEKETLAGVTEMRSRVGKVTAPKDLGDIGTQSRKILDNIIAVMEAYPDLKAQENVKELMKAIQDIETEVSRHRYVYNNIVQEYNTKTEVIPSNIVANLFNFKRLDYLEFEEEISERPDTSW